MPIEYPASPDKKSTGELDVYNVLVADDDRTMAELLATNLRRLGHRVVAVAWNGKEAVNLALKHRPDVVVMDIHMPVMDGLEASREILSKHLVPIVLSTGQTDARSLNNAVDLNLISYLVKPFSPAQLKVAVHMAVAQVRAAQPASIASAA
jgi:CheY-like chemotaxis protein